MVRSAHKAEQYYTGKEICTSSILCQTGARGAVYSQGWTVLHSKRDLYVLVNNVMPDRCPWRVLLTSGSVRQPRSRWDGRELVADVSPYRSRCTWRPCLSQKPNTGIQQTVISSSSIFLAKSYTLSPPKPPFYQANGQTDRPSRTKHVWRRSAPLNPNPKLMDRSASMFGEGQLL